MLLPTLGSGLTLLTCDRPDHVNRNQHSNGAPFGFQCCFLVNQDRIVTKKRVNIKSQNRQLPTPQVSPKLCCLYCPWWTKFEASNARLCVHTSSKIFNPVGSLTRQDTGPGWQLSSPTDCLTLVKTRALCHPLAKLGAGLSRQLW